MSAQRVLRAFLVALAVTAAVAPSVAATSEPPTGAATYEGPGAASAEDAVTAYMNGLADADLEAMVGSFAVETYVEHFDFRAYLERIQAYSVPAMPLSLPADTPFTEALAVEQRHGSVVQQILAQSLRLVAPEFDPSGAVVSLSDAAELEEFYAGLAAGVAELDTSAIGSFTFVPLADADPDAAADYESEQNQSNIDAQRAVLGADEITDVVVRFVVSGREYFAFFSVVRYGDAWWVEQLGGNFASLMGVPIMQVGAAPVDEIS